MTVEYDDRDETQFSSLHHSVDGDAPPPDLASLERLREQPIQAMPTMVPLMMLFMGLVGLVMVGFCFHAIISSHKSRKWPSVNGRVIESRVVQADYSGGSPGTRNVTKAEVKFRYQVDGKVFESGNLYFGTSQIGGTSRFYPSNVAGQYPVGKQIQVSYDPGNPANAVVDISIGAWPYLGLIVGLVMVVGYTTFLIRLHRKPPDRLLICDGDGSFKIVASTRFWAIVGLSLALFMLGTFVVRLWHGAALKECLPILLGVGIAAICGIAFSEKRVFYFDVTRRHIAWSQRNLFGRKLRTIAFDKIRSAVVQSYRGPGQATFNIYSGMSFRVALVTKDGIIPLSRSYLVGQVSDLRCQQIRSKINHVVGIKLASESDNDILELARNNCPLWAQSMARARYGLSSTQAFEYVKRLMQKYEH